MHSFVEQCEARDGYSDQYDHLARKISEGSSLKVGVRTVISGDRGLDEI